MKSLLFKTLTLSLAAYFCAALPASALVMSSTNYQIERDSVNFGGGLDASANYNVESTLGEAASGPSASSTARLAAGYQQFDGSFVSIVLPDSLTLSPAINNNDGGVAAASGTVIVNTDNSAGYTLSIRSATSPALKYGSYGFAEYATSSTAPDYAWNFGSSSSAFGFSAEGSDITATYRDDGSKCNVAFGADTPDTCWSGLSLSDQTISQSNSANNPAGAATTLKFKAETKPISGLTAGSYAATVIVTAIAN